MLTHQQVSIWMRAWLERELTWVRAWLNQHIGFDWGMGFWSTKILELGVLQRELNKHNHMEREARCQ